MSGEKRDISNVQAEGDKISYFVFESVQARNERTIKRLWISTIILVILLFVSNALWLWFFSGAEVESYEVTADSNSNAYYNEISNNEIDQAIELWVKGARNREIMRDRLINTMTYEKIAEKYELSVRYVKTLIYHKEEIIFKHI